MSSTCPECTKDVPVKPDARVTSIVACPGCDAELEVVTADPFVLALAPQIEEDFGE
jgi:alpha-aminoadipate/glutamate carrier protein LysW